MTAQSRIRVSQLLEPLLSLQELDQKIEAITQEENKWPVWRKEIEGRLFEIESRLEHLETLRKQKIMERDRLNLEVQEEIQRALTYERHLKEVKTNREYQALLHELGQSRKARQEVEEVLLKVMTELEGIEKEIDIEKEALIKTRTELQEFQKQEEMALHRLAGEKKELLERRKDIVSRVKPQLLSRYQFVRKRYTNVIAYATDSTCSGCQRKLPPQMYILVLKEEEVVTCPACQRFLLAPAALETTGVTADSDNQASTRLHSHP